MPACVLWNVVPAWDGHGTEEVQCNKPAVAIAGPAGSVCSECLAGLKADGIVVEGEYVMLSAEEPVVDTQISAQLVDCPACKGSRVTYEKHDYCDEELGCQDCRGTGKAAAS